MCVCVCVYERRPSAPEDVAIYEPLPPPPLPTTFICACVFVCMRTDSVSRPECSAAAAVAAAASVVVGYYTAGPRAIQVPQQRHTTLCAHLCAGIAIVGRTSAGPNPESEQSYSCWGPALDPQPVGVRRPVRPSLKGFSAHMRARRARCATSGPPHLALLSPRPPVSRMRTCSFFFFCFYTIIVVVFQNPVIVKMIDYYSFSNWITLSESYPQVRQRAA